MPSGSSCFDLLKWLAWCCGSSRASIAPSIRQAVLHRKGSKTMDIATLLLCPDPTRSISRSYKVLETLGSGGFGSVRRVHHLPTGEDRAIKVIAKSAVHDVDRLVVEVQALIQLDHPNIMKFYEYFEGEQFMYLVTELCTGGDLGTLDRDEDDMDEIRRLIRDVVAAVAYCHSEGIAHRDLKFQNVLLHSGDSKMRRSAKVIDFGLAAIRKQGETSDEWMDDTVGTVYFIAPEVMKSDISMWQRYGMQCDMWSIGIMIHILLTDQHPFAKSAQSREVVTERIAKHSFRTGPMDEACVDPLARDLIMKLLVKDPQDRLSAEAALEHQWFKEQSPVSCASPTFRTPKSTQAHLRRIIDRVISFSRFSRFEQAILTLVAHEANRREVDDLRSAFSKLDVKKAGWLSQEGVRSALTTNGVQLPEADINAVLQALDPDKDDKIQYTDWLAATLKASTITSDKAISELFHFFDVHGDGKVSRADLQEVLGDAVAEEVFMEANGNSSEELSPEDFRTLMIEVAKRLEMLQRPRSYTSGKIRFFRGLTKDDANLSMHL